MSPCFLGVTLMQHGNVSNIASFSKKNDELRYVSLTRNLKVAQAVCYKQEQASNVHEGKEIPAKEKWDRQRTPHENASSVGATYWMTVCCFLRKNCKQDFWKCLFHHICKWNDEHEIITKNRWPKWQIWIFPYKINIKNIYQENNLTGWNKRNVNKRLYSA